MKLLFDGRVPPAMFNRAESKSTLIEAQNNKTSVCHTLAYTVRRGASDPFVRLSCSLSLTVMTHSAATSFPMGNTALEGAKLYSRSGMRGGPRQKKCNRLGSAITEQTTTPIPYLDLGYGLLLKSGRNRYR